MKIRNRLILVTSIVLAVLSTSWSGRGKQPPSLAADIQPTPSAQASDQIVDAKLVAANTKLSFKLFSQILKQQPDENIFISGASVAMSLDIAYNGASGQTQQAIAQTLELQGMSLQEINQANASLKATLETLDPNVHVSIANSLWAAQNKPFNPEFIQKIQGFYKAQVTNLDFGAPGASNIINDWVKQSTNGKIDNIVDHIGSDTVFVLLNAIYFKGNWTEPFPKNTTKEYPFTLLNGTQKQHPMMFHEFSDVAYYQNELFQVVELPYTEGRLSMYIFLPNREISLKTFYKSLTAENWATWMNQLEMNKTGDLSRETLIGLPRFKVEYSIDLKEALEALGMKIAFTKYADFSAMSSSQLSIDKVKHKAFVEVNEQGTEAAGVTEVSFTRGGNQMIIDHPFFFAIRDNQTGTLLFLGSIVEPIE